MNPAPSGGWRGGRRGPRKSGVKLPGMAAARKAAGLSFFALAKMIGLDPSTLSRYERQEIFASPEMARRIAEALSTTADALTGKGAA